MKAADKQLANGRVVSASDMSDEVFVKHIAGRRQPTARDAGRAQHCALERRPRGQAIEAPARCTATARRAVTKTLFVTS